MPYFRLVDGDFRYFMDKIDKVDATIRNLYDIIVSGPFSGHLQVYGGVYSDPAVGLPARNSNAAGLSSAGSATDGQTNNHSTDQTSKQNTGFSRREGMNESVPARDNNSHLRASGLQPSQRPADKQQTGSRGSTAAATTFTTTERSTGNRTSWADRARESNVDTETDTDGGNGAQWEIDRRERKRRRVRSAQQENSEPQPDEQQRQEPQRTNRRSKSGPLLVGKGQFASTDYVKRLSCSGGKVNKISAAKPLVKKVVYCVDKLSTDVKATDLVAFVQSAGVQVITCFKAKPRRTANKKRMKIVDKDRKAFRLCINRDHEDKLLNADIWPENVVVSKWFWSQSENNDYYEHELTSGDDDGYDERTGSTENTGEIRSAAAADVIGDSVDPLQQFGDQQQQQQELLQQADEIETGGEMQTNDGGVP